MIHPPGSTPKRPRSGGPRRPRAAWSRPPSARTPGAPTPARCGASTLGSTGASSTTRRSRPLRRAARCRPRLVERFDGGRRGVLPREAGRAARSRRRADGPGAGRVPADRLRSGSRAQPFGLSDLAAVLATCHRPRRRGRGVESEEVALERGRLDAVITEGTRKNDERNGQENRRRKRPKPTWRKPGRKPCGGHTSKRSPNGTPQV